MHNENAIHAIHGWGNLEQILAFKLEHEREMNRKHSKVKLRWMRSIHKVIVLNYVAKVLSTPP